MITSITPSIFIRPFLILGAEEYSAMAEDKSEQPELIEVTPTEERSLLKQVAERDVTALSRLYDEYSRLLMSVILAVLKDKAEAEDILQESFLTIWNKAGMYKPHLGKPTSWMVTIAKNKAYDRYRKLVRTREGMIILKDAIGKESCELELATESEFLKYGLQGLNFDQKEVIELVFYQGFTQQEAADRLETPLGTVKARIRRGLLQLKHYLSNN